ncbi:MAG: hypothetical protein A2629_00230 [Candidatus Levybacteria bacterium RIFCSPHIGHO2_01_FULL_41_15]|nr:MAG: hypothetical protein A2629_00230 [Candidatus Levybacteria bacterium RIFCSPHIGHO2_01_FULL_41_15]
MKKDKLTKLVNFAKWGLVILLLIYIAISLKTIENKIETAGDNNFKRFGPLQYDLEVGILKSMIIDLEEKIDKQSQLLEYIDENTRNR